MIECINSTNCLEVIKNLFIKINKKVTEFVNKGSWPDDIKILVKINKLALIVRLKDHKAGMSTRSVVTNCPFTAKSSVKLKNIVFMKIGSIKSDQLLDVKSCSPKLTEKAYTSKYKIQQVNYRFSQTT